jgi:hypothetical protein
VRPVSVDAILQLIDVRLVNESFRATISRSV